MKRTIASLATLFSLLCTGNAQSTFQRLIDLDPIDSLTDVKSIVTSDGGVLMMGRHGHQPWLLSKADANGAPVWSEHLAIDTVANGGIMSPTSDGGSVLLFQGYTSIPIGFDSVSQTMHVVRLDVSGGVLWSRSVVFLSDPNAFGAGLIALTATSTGSVYFAIDMSSGLLDGGEYVFKMDPLGNLQWCKYLGDWLSGILSLRATSSGGCVFVEQNGIAATDRVNIGSIDASGELQWCKSFWYTNGAMEMHAQCILPTSNNDLVTGGQILIPGSPVKIWSMRLSPDGGLEWFQLYAPNSPVDQGFNSIVELPTNDLVFSSHGSFQSQHLLRTDPSGVPISFYRSSTVSLPPYDYAVAWNDIGISGDQLMFKGQMRKTHQIFANYTITPMLWRIDGTPADACFLDTTSAADYLVPESLVNILDTGHVESHGATMFDVGVTITPAAQFTSTDLCTLVSISENSALAPRITVAPSILDRGQPITIFSPTAGWVELISASGAHLRTEKLRANGTLELPTDDLRAGIYILRGIDAKGSSLGTAKVAVR